MLLEAALQNLKTAERKLKKTETAIESIPCVPCTAAVTSVSAHVVNTRMRMCPDT